MRVLSRYAKYNLILFRLHRVFISPLWLLEDMSFALVHNVSMVIKSGDFYYATEYRSIVKLLKERDDLFFTPESLTEELEEMCIPQWENEATIYEL